MNKNRSSSRPDIPDLEIHEYSEDTPKYLKSDVKDQDESMDCSCIFKVKMSRNAEDEKWTTDRFELDPSELSGTLCISPLTEFILVIQPFAGICNVPMQGEGGILSIEKSDPRTGNSREFHSKSGFHSRATYACNFLTYF